MHADVAALIRARFQHFKQELSPTTLRRALVDQARIVEARVALAIGAFSTAWDGHVLAPTWDNVDDEMAALKGAGGPAAASGPARALEGRKLFAGDEDEEDSLRKEIEQLRTLAAEAAKQYDAGNFEGLRKPAAAVRTKADECLKLSEAKREDSSNAASGVGRQRRTELNHARKAKPEGTDSSMSGACSGAGGE